MCSLPVDQALADQMVQNAIVFCAEKKFSGDVEQARLALRRGRCDACEYLSYSLVRQIGEYLGQLDKNVKAIYAFKPDKAPFTHEGGNVTAGRRASSINLITWVDRKSAALNSLTNTLETVLSVGRKRVGCVNATPACCNVSIALIDDKEVSESRGLGAMIQSMYVRSIQVWTRMDDFQQARLASFRQGKLGANELTSFNPEIAPEELVFEQALSLEQMPAEARASIDYRLQEQKVVLIRKLISEQLDYINLAKRWLTVSELLKVRKRKIGYGKVGGKAAGLLLAASILEQVGDEKLKACLRIPESYYLGSDLVYVYMSSNGLTHWNDQKYKPVDQILAEYHQIQEEFKAGEFPPDILEKLQSMLDEVGPQPVIVRSSSQLEDNFGTSFAGKYNSYFCPNQGSRAENLRNLTRAIALAFASTFKPDALLYRRSKGLQDYDERMAILVQVVQGEPFGRYYLPHAAGVAFSRNLYRWSPQIKREEGFARLVWGLGTRAVERVGNDYPRLVAVGHPNLQPDDSPEAIRHYSQQYVDLIDLQENRLVTLPIHQVLQPNYAPLRYLVQLEQDGCFTPLRTRLPENEIPRLAVTFSEFLRRTNFAAAMKQILETLEINYGMPVDIEFTAQVADPSALQPQAIITLLQCRPQSRLRDVHPVPIPKNLPEDKLIFSTNFMVPQGYANKIQYVLFVTPEGYFHLCTGAARNEIGRIVGKLNAKLESKSFICMGPGRWGTTNPDLGVYVLYADITNAAALVEMAGGGYGPAPEPSLGTHFFQDLMEAEIYPLALFMDQPGTRFNRDFFYNTPNCLARILPEAAAMESCLRLIDVHDILPGSHIELVMDDDQGQAVAYIVSPA